MWNKRRTKYGTFKKDSKAEKSNPATSESNLKTKKKKRKHFPEHKKKSSLN